MSQNSSPINVKFGSGTFYIVSKTNPGEGWQGETVNNPQTGEEINRFRKDIGTIVGTVQWVGLKESPFKGVGLTLGMLVKSEDGETYSFEVPMLSSKGVKATDDYFKSLVGPLQNITKGDKVSMFLNSKNKDKNDRLYKNVVFLDADGKLIKSNYSFSDIPKWNSTESIDYKGDKTMTYDPTPTNAYFYNIAKEVAEKFEKAPEQGEVPKQGPAPENDGPDDLPF